jgi:phenylpropionate dioxygenase-like ring-hydroxylating dioxygenase large terminal subunit
LHFHQPRPAPRQSLKDFIGEHADRLGGCPFGEMTAVYEYYTILNCNWKIAWDAFSEAYHVPTIHAGSFPGVFEAEVKQVGMYGIRHSGAAHQKPSPPTAPVAALSYQLATASIAKPGHVARRAQTRVLGKSSVAEPLIIQGCPWSN